MVHMLLSAASMLALASGAASAEPKYQPETAAKEATSPDARAVTSLEDARAFAKKEFAMLDANGDKKVEKAEFLAAVAKAEAPGAAAPAPGMSAEIPEGDGAETAEQQFAGIAKNGVAFVEKDLVDARLADFKSADADADGALDDAEKTRFVEIVGRAPLA